jgi:CheY-like chemotaxis protein
MPKVLIIEDDELVSRMYAKVLTYEGIEVVVAGSGREGIEKAKQEQPELIFCDVMMPQMNGIEVLERLKADGETSEIPVIMLTNLSGTQDAELAVQKGAVAYLVKSEHRPKELAGKVKEFVKVKGD